MRDSRPPFQDGQERRAFPILSVSDLLSELVRDLTALVRGELRLARAELTESVRLGIRSLKMVAAGGVLLLVALIMASQALALALSPVVGVTWAATLVAFGFAVVGLILLMRGRRNLTAAQLLPDRSMAQTSRDLDLAKEQL